MKIISFLLITLSFCSCEVQNSNALKIDASKVKEINIINKVYCSYNKLVKAETTITDRDKIEKIIDTFSYMQPIQDRGSVNLKVSNGFFEMSFKEEDQEHYYTIHYTTYDGVIIWSNDEGKLFKNDRLEIVVYKQFID